MKHSVIGLVATTIILSFTAFAQTPVTTTGGTTNHLTEFSGTTTVVDSVITDNSGTLQIGPYFTINTDGTSTMSASGKGTSFDAYGVSSSTFFASDVFSYSDAGSHSTETHNAQAVYATPSGSGEVNGTIGGDLGFNVSTIKKGYGASSANSGMISAMNAVTRQASDGDASGLTIDVAREYNVTGGANGDGFTDAGEFVTNLLGGTGATSTQGIDLQLGVIFTCGTTGYPCNGASDYQIGYLANSTTGTNGYAFRAQSGSGASWTNYFTGFGPNGQPNFSVAGNGDVILYDATGSTKTLRNDTSNDFAIVNTAGSQELINLTDGGNLTIHGTVGMALGTSGSTTLCRNGSGMIAGCSSSIRYKHAVRNFGEGMGVVQKLRPVSFLWKDGGNGGRRDVGLIAEEVNQVEPELVSYDGQGKVDGVKYDRISVLLVNTVKEQQAQLQQEQNEIRTLLALVCTDHPGAEVCTSKN